MYCVQEEINNKKKNNLNVARLGEEKRPWDV